MFETNKFTPTSQHLVLFSRRAEQLQLRTNNPHNTDRHLPFPLRIARQCANNSHIKCIWTVDTCAIRGHRPIFSTPIGVQPYALPFPANAGWFPPPPAINLDAFTDNQAPPGNQTNSPPPTSSTLNHDSRQAPNQQTGIIPMLEQMIAIHGDAMMDEKNRTVLNSVIQALQNSHQPPTTITATNLPVSSAPPTATTQQNAQTTIATSTISTASTFGTSGSTMSHQYPPPFGHGHGYGHQPPYPGNYQFGWPWYQPPMPPPPQFQPQPFMKTEPPKITPKNTEHSFSKFESWLNINNIFDDERRFLALKMQLDTSTYTQVNHAIYNPPPNGRYEALKRAVIKVFADSESKKIHELISGLKLGDKKPSTLLAEMRNLHRGSLDNQIFRELWLSRLPTQVQTILVGLTRNPAIPPPSLEQMAEVADGIMEYHSNSNQIHAISQTPQNDHLSGVTEMLTKITERLNKLELPTDNRRSRSRDRSNSRSDSRSSSRNDRQSRKRTPTPSTTDSSTEGTICTPHQLYGQGKHLNRRCYRKCPLYHEWLKVELERSKNP